MADRKPLWEVMHEAAMTALIGDTIEADARNEAAAELRAIAREIAKRDPDNTMSALAVEEWLLAEAAEAEVTEDRADTLSHHS
jgi:hypothetical protein